MLAILLHFLVGLLGLALLYSALFLHETEEGQLQNRLERLWITIDDLSKTALSKQTAFLQQVSAMANSALNKLFGARLFSAGVVSASVCFSIGSVLFFMAFVIKSPNSGLSYFAWPFLVVGLLSFLVGFSPVPFRYLGLLWIPGSVFFLLYIDRDIADWDWDWITKEFLPVLIIFLGGSPPTTKPDAVASYIKAFRGSRFGFNIKSVEQEPPPSTMYRIEGLSADNVLFALSCHSVPPGYYWQDLPREEVIERLQRYDNIEAYRKNATERVNLASENPKGVMLLFAGEEQRQQESNDPVDEGKRLVNEIFDQCAVLNRIPNGNRVFRVTVISSEL